MQTLQRHGREAMRHCLFDLALISRAAAENADCTTGSIDATDQRPTCAPHASRRQKRPSADSFSWLLGRHIQYGVHTEVHRIASDRLRSHCDGPGLVFVLLCWFLCLSRASRAQSHSHSPHTAKLPTTFLCGSWCMKRSPAVNLPSGPRRTR